MPPGRRTYKSYSINPKLHVIKTGDPYYFSDVGMPRTTALYSPKNPKKVEVLEGDSNELFETKIKALEKELTKVELEKMKEVKIVLMLTKIRHFYSRPYH